MGHRDSSPSGRERQEQCRVRDGLEERITQWVLERSDRLWSSRSRLTTRSRALRLPLLPDGQGFPTASATGRIARGGFPAMTIRWLAVSIAISIVLAAPSANLARHLVT